ncbi:lipase family protein [Nocardia sp. AG03]|uniref:lipase family protein n=1 Tax=Nocardia sp. AG03 TaxID=3025312 RepID=UPI0024184FE4|nr:lipase family protein [Nocardia sp. AG03]
MSVAVTATGVTVAGATPNWVDFYSPSASAIAGEHGSVIWSRPITGDPAIPGARNELVLYRSVDVAGNPVAVSGMVVVPDGPAPAGGWPMISWAHGTTGTADVCAPSRDTADGFPAHDYTARVREMLARYVSAGYAVAMTDYQGLGVDGAHGYLIGEAEQRAVADMALAARELVPGIGTEWVAMGHSQGGQAAIFAAARSQAWAPQLELRGAVAMAPASHLGALVQGLGAVRNVGISTGRALPPGLLAFLPLIIRGAETTGEVDPATFLTPRGLDLLAQADNACVAQLRATDSWGGAAPADVFVENADLRPLQKVLDDNDPSSLKPTVPLLVQQGSADTVVFPLATEAMLAEQRVKGQAVDSRTYQGSDHRGVLEAGFDDALGWIDARFGR